MKRIIKTINLLFTLFGIAAMLYAIYWPISQLVFEKRSIATTATVKSVEIKTYESGTVPGSAGRIGMNRGYFASGIEERYLYKLQLEVDLPAGRTQKSTMTTLGGFSEGDRLRILYNPANPQQVFPPLKWSKILAFSLALFMIGVIAICLGNLKLIRKLERKR